MHTHFIELNWRSSVAWRGVCALESDTASGNWKKCDSLFCARKQSPLRSSKKSCELLSSFAFDVFALFRCLFMRTIRAHEVNSFLVLGDVHWVPVPTRAAR